MKNLKTITKYPFTALLFIMMCSFSVSAQNKIDYGIFASSTCNQLEVRVRPNYSAVSSNFLTNNQFTIKWPVSSGITDLIEGPGVAPYFMSQQYVLPEFSGPIEHNGYYYQVWINLGQGNLAWTANQEYVIQTFSYVGASAPVFEIAHDDFVINDINADFYFEVSGIDRTGILYSASTSPISGRWLGTTSTDWNTPTNWCGGVPTAITDVIIPAASTVPNSPTLSTLSVIKSLTINTDGQLTIASQGKLTINNDLVNNASNGLVIKSTSAGTGSLISMGNISGSGTFKVEKFITYGTGTRFQYISIPVTTALTNVFYMYYMYKFNEPTNAWLNMYINNPMEVFKGYAVTKNITTDTKEFVGMVNNGLVGSANNLTRTSPTTGWNLVGNPYPSAVDWDALTGWTKTHTYDAIYTWNQTQKTYAAYISGDGINGGTNIIQSMQAFMIRVEDGVSFGTLQMTNAVRVHDNANFTKSKAVNTLRLTATSGDFSDETLIRFNPLASNQFDKKWDAQKMMSNDAMAQLYSNAGNENLSINTLPEITDNLSVPLNLKIQEDGIYILTASELESFNTGYIYLEDMKLNRFTNLKEMPAYSFGGSMDDNAARFKIHFSLTPLNVENENASQLSYYSFEKMLYINTPQNAKGNIEIFNLLGERLFASELQATTSNVVNLDKLASGYYMVKISNANEVVSGKIMLK